MRQHKIVMKSLIVLWIIHALHSLSFAQVPYRTPVEVLREHVLDQLFSTDPGSRDYAIRIVLRFTNPDSEIVLFRYFGGDMELIRYSLMTNSGKTVSDLTAEMLRSNPHVNPKDIAAKFRVQVDRSPVNQKKLLESLDALQRIKVPPYPQIVIPVDRPSTYDYWFDSSGQVIHYSLYGPHQQTDLDDLLQWMMGFRAEFK